MAQFTFLSQLKLRNKFLVLSVIGLLIASVPTVLVMRSASRDLAVFKAERSGMAPVATALNAVQLTQQHRAQSALALGGASGDDKRMASQAETDKSFADLGAVVKQLNRGKLTEAWEPAQQEWQALRASVSSRSITVAQSDDAHARLVASLLQVQNQLADLVGLQLDPDRDTHQLIQAMYYQLPYLTEELGQLLAKGTGLLAKKEISAEERIELGAVIGQVRHRRREVVLAYDKAAQENPGIGLELGDGLREAMQAVTGLTQLANEQIATAEVPGYAVQDFVNQATAAMDAQFALGASASNMLAAVLDEKIAGVRRTLSIMFGSMLALVAVAALVVTQIARSVTGPIQHAVEVAENVARGKLTTMIEAGAEDEAGKLLQALKQMNEGLRQMVGTVRTSILHIADATGDIASGNADVSGRLESQASSLEETASAMEELTATVKQNAHNARHANQLMMGTSQAASRGGDVVANVVRTMGEIDLASRRVVEIIGIMDGIAFQTNILALNASVEAARAGEQGRGFAVVASEVRNLAHRSSEAAREIKGLVSLSLEKVEAGNRLVGEAGVAMEEIVSNVGQVTTIMSEIATASDEQEAGIEQVNLAVSQMDATTQHNAALVEQTAAASASLREQTQALTVSMDVFELDAQGQGSGAQAGKVELVRSHNAVAPRVLGLVERQVGLGDQVGRAASGGGDHGGYADAEGDNAKRRLGVR